MMNGLSMMNYTLSIPYVPRNVIFESPREVAFFSRCPVIRLCAFLKDGKPSDLSEYSVS